MSPVSPSALALMEKWSVEQLPALVSDLTVECSFGCTFIISPSLLLSILKYLILSYCLFLSLSCVCVSQWTVAGAAGRSGALAVEHVTSVWEGGTDQGPIPLQLLADTRAKETELGLTPVALNPALVRSRPHWTMLLYIKSRECVWYLTDSKEAGLND